MFGWFASRLFVRFCFEQKRCSVYSAGSSNRVSTNVQDNNRPFFGRPAGAVRPYINYTSEAVSLPKVCGDLVPNRSRHSVVNDMV